MAPSASNLMTILGAAVLAWLFGAAYYGVLGKTWLAAQGRTMEEMKAANANKSSVAKAFPFVLSLLAEIVMATVLLGLLAHMKMVTLQGGLLTAGFVWVGFVLPTIWVNNAYPSRSTALTLIDAGHWLGVLLVMGAVVGGGS